MTDWPQDIEDESDLLSRLAYVSLRSDVKKYLWRIIDEVIPADKYCNMHYFGEIKSLKGNLPIRIDVPENYVEALKDRISTISNQILSHYENMLPIHLVEIQGIPERRVVIPIEEGFYSSGTPGKIGTLGGIIKHNKTCCRIPVVMYIKQVTNLLMFVVLMKILC